MARKFTLPKTDNLLYWKALKEWGEKESDGCTGVPDHYIEACWEHDWHHKYGVTLYGEPISFEETNTRFRDVIQMLSRWKWFSPLSWIRYYGVTFLGRIIWNRWRTRNLSAPFILEATVANQSDPLSPQSEPAETLPTHPDAPKA